MNLLEWYCLVIVESVEPGELGIAFDSDVIWIITEEDTHDFINVTEQNDHYLWTFMGLDELIEQARNGYS